MPDPFSIADGDILERLRDRFDLTADTLEFLALGHDADAWVYRVHARDGDRFLKVRRGTVNEAGLTVPGFWVSEGSCI